jgi:hypothetical protein
MTGNRLGDDIVEISTLSPLFALRYPIPYRFNLDIFFFFFFDPYLIIVVYNQLSIFFADILYEETKESIRQYDNNNFDNDEDTTKVVSSYPTRGEVYLIQHYVITFISELRQLHFCRSVVFSGYSGFLHQ